MSSESQPQAAYARGQSAPANIAGATNGGRAIAKRRPRVLMALLMMGFSIFLALAVCEIGLRLFGNVTDMVRNFWDPVIGTRRLPNQQGRYVVSSIRGRYHFNAQGWNSERDYDVERPAGTKRICIVGDSIVEALQVEPGQRFFELAEAKMSRAGRTVQWMPFGCSGFGTGQEYNLIRHYVLDYRPDVVVLMFAENDVNDTSPYLTKLEEFLARWKLDEQGGLVPVPPSKPFDLTLVRRIIPEFALTRLAWVTRENLVQRKKATQQEGLILREGAASVAGAAEISRGAQEKSWKLEEALLAACKAECDRRGALFAVAWRGNVTRIRASLAGKEYTPPSKESDPWCLGARLFEMGAEQVEPICNRLDIPFVDLTDAIIAQQKEENRRSDYPDDTHYNEVGHRAVGKVFSEWMEDLLKRRGE